jgi:hypothetical protein
METPTEKWQANLNGKIFETDLDILISWVSEGRVTAEDKVKKGNLNWIAAGRVPALRGHFQAGGKLAGDPSAVKRELAPQPGSAPQSTLQATGEEKPRSVHDGGEATSPDCRRHPQIPAEYICRVCQAMFCAQCPEFVGSSRIPTCPLCGDLCLRLSDQPKALDQPAPAIPSESNFGCNSLGNALRYPFKFPTALIVAACVYGFLQLGSIIGMRSGLMAVMLANGLLFGCLAQVVKQIAWGRFESSFLGGFDSFSIWDNAIRPTLFGFGILLVTFGPFLLLLVALMSGWLGNASDVPLTPARLESQAQQQGLTSDELKALINSENPEKDAEVMRKLNKLRPANQAQDMVNEKTPQSSYETLLPVAGQFLTGAPGWLLGLFLLVLLWAIAYYPMALIVAGYSEDFGSLLNPMVGLDTIRRMGEVYLRVFLMYLVVQGLGFGLALLSSMATRFMTLPLMGNLPGRILNGIVTFYSSLAVAYLLGLALHDRAAELNIPTD